MWENLLLSMKVFESKHFTFSNFEYLYHRVQMSHGVKIPGVETLGEGTNSGGC